MTIGENIKKIRKERKMTQEQLAKELEISRSFLGDVENNRRNISSKTVEKLSKKLGVSMVYLTTGEETYDDIFPFTMDYSYIDSVGDKFRSIDEQNKNEKLTSLLHSLNNASLSLPELNFLLDALVLLKNADTETIKKMSDVLAIVDPKRDYWGETVQEDREYILNNVAVITELLHEFVEKNSNSNKED